LVPQPKTAEYEVAETGTTFVENAIIKARHASRLSGLPALADDSGLIVPALQGEPGVYSARYAGAAATDQDNVNKLLQQMAALKTRRAHFYCCLVFMRHHQDPDPMIAKGLWPGEISTQAAGDGGFGYDPVFYVPTHGCTAAELAPEIKRSLSHRARAIELLTAQLKDGIA
jgi:XTP/dITP diphosphohydrolase